MKNSVNIIIPSIELSKDLLKCLSEINKLKYKNFFVSIVLDKKNKQKVKKYKFKLNILIVKKKTSKNRANMSYKRNIAVRKFKSQFIALLDSDAYPHKNWLTKGVKNLDQNKGDITGGPSVPFPNQSYSQKIAYFCKRSYFITGYQNFRKFKAKARLCDWLESCNIILRRNFYLKHKGMNEKKYIGEDKDFFERVRKTKKNLKVYYDPNLYIYHRDRSFFGFLLQRFCFGLSFLSLIKLDIGLKGFQSTLPFLTSLLFLTITFLHFDLSNKLIIMTSILLFIILLIYLEINLYVTKFKDRIYTIFGIILGNISFALAGYVFFLGIKALIVDWIYILSRRK